jgi:hypothetical protein
MLHIHRSKCSDKSFPLHHKYLTLPILVVHHFFSYRFLIITPINEAGCRQHCSCTEQVMALTSHKTGAVFVDLTAAYDTVWRDGLMIKLLEAVPCLKLFNLLNNMLSNRYIRVFLGNQSSRDV